MLNCNAQAVEPFRIRLAEKKIEVRCLYPEAQRLCRDYAAEFAVPDFVVETTEADIEQERTYTAQREQQEGRPAGKTSAGQLETLAVYRKIARQMLDYDTMLIHGAAVAVENRCWLFLAKSGVGKTTHIQNWLRMVPGAFVVNGDKPLVDIRRGLVYGTPWCGKESMGENLCKPLTGLIALERGTENRIAEISFGEMLPCLLQQSYRPEIGDGALRVLRLLEGLKAVPCYRLWCNMEPESAVICYDKLRRSHD